MSDELGLPMKTADVIRLDVATNIIVDHPVPVYLNHLGSLSRYQRSEQSRGLYYNNSVNKKERTRQLAFYDKIADYKAKKLQIPLEYQGKNVFRYELRFLKQLLKQFNLPFLKAEKLYEEKFFKYLVNRWHKEYEQINKIKNKKTLNFSIVNNVTKLKEQGLVFLIKDHGGETKFLKSIEMAQKQGKLDKTKAFKLKQAAKTVSNSKLYLSNSNVVAEIDNKINEVICFMLINN